jgi:hypothetical protein
MHQRFQAFIGWARQIEVKDQIDIRDNIFFKCALTRISNQTIVIHEFLDDRNLLGLIGDVWGVADHDFVVGGSVVCHDGLIDCVVASSISFQITMLSLSILKKREEREKDDQ